jgi:hypothetical protein
LIGKTTKVNIGEKEITIKELSIKEIKNLQNSLGSQDTLEKEMEIKEGWNYVDEGIFDVAINGISDEAIEVNESLDSIKIENATSEKVTVQYKKGKAFGELIQGKIEEITGLKPEEFEELYPSQLEMIWSKFQEVNSTFLKFLGFMGIKMESLGKIIQSQLMKQFAA